MNYDPNYGGWILFVGGPKDGTFIFVGSDQRSIVVAEYRPGSMSDPHLKPYIESRYHIKKIPWGLRGRGFWWIMEHESLKPLELTLAGLLASERRALDKLFPPPESCALPLTSGPLCDWPSLPRLAATYGYKIPNPWKYFGGIASA